MEEETVYGVDKNLKNCKRRLQNDPDISQKVKDEILRFVNILDIQSVSKHRQYFYIERLKILARIMGDSFIDPSDDDLILAISKIKEAKNKRGKEYSSRTIQDILQSIKKFYGSLKANNDKRNLKWIKINTSLSQEKKPKDIVTLEERNSMLNACDNDRDRCLISMLYDSGCRIGELLTLKNKDIVFDEFGMTLTVAGKTGVRRIEVVGDSVIYARTYKQKYKRDNPNEHFFINFKDLTPMNYYAVNTMFYKVTKRAKLTRRINPHLFRHTRATIYSKELQQPVLESYMGWKPGSRMARVYIHLSQDDVKDAILRIYGIERPKNDKSNSQVEVPKICLRCGEKNPSISEYCLKCGMPLDKNKIFELNTKRDEVISNLLESSVVDDITKGTIKNIAPQAIDFLISAVLKGITEKPELRNKFIQELSRKV